MTNKLETELDALLEESDLTAEIARHEALLGEVGVPYPTGSPRPFLCSEARVDAFERVSGAIYRAIETITRLYFDDGRFHDDLPLPPHLARIVHADHGYRETNVFCRFDIHVGDDPNDVRVLELNCADPSAIAWHDWMLRAVTGTRGFERFAGRHRLSYRQLVPLHWRTVRALDVPETRDAGVALADGVTLAIADDSSVRFDFRALARLYGRIGVTAEVTPPNGFELRGGRLFAGERPVSVVIRDTLDEVTLPAADARLSPLRTAFSDASTYFVNPTSAVLADQKTMLELLSDPDAVPEIPASDRAVLEQAIPWTRTLRHRTTSHRDREIDLVRWVLERRKRLVLKPAEGYGGFGVTVGRAVDDAVWHDRVAAALEAKHPFVVQEYVAPSWFIPPPTRAAPTTSQAPVPFNLSLWCFRGAFVGAIARASASPVVNVHQGGLLQPVVFYD